jgi:hypothetical protein
MLAGMALIEMANANDYSSGMANRISRAFSLRLAEYAKGKKMNLGGWQPRWIDFNGERGHDGEFTFNAHAETVRRIVDEYLSGASMCRIARGLIRDQVPNLRGGKWGQGTVRSILQSELLVGHMEIITARLRSRRSGPRRR